MSNFLEIALSAHAAGLCVVPPRMDGSKAPLPRTWKTFQQARPDPDQLRRWYSDGLTGIGAIPGAVSGNLEVLEFDDADTYQHFKDEADEAGTGPIIARLEQGYVEASPGGGIHWLYRCDEIGGNTKLATRPDGTDDHGRPRVKTLIETRGEGGFIILAPSNGKVHPTGRAYRLLGGGFATIPHLSPEERRDLLALARTFHVPDPAKIRDPDPRPAGTTTGERPGDAFNARALWSDVLGPHGWIRLYARGETTYWRRPGKREGVSAATNWQGRDYLFVWSSSTPFETETPITKFAAYAALEHGGDLKRAAKALAEQGYGEPTVKASKPRAEHYPRPATVRVLAGGLPEASDEAEAALIQHDGGIYQRSGYLCRISRQLAATVRGINRPMGAVTITPLDRDAMLDRLNRSISWEKWSEKASDYKRCHAPAAVAMTLLARSGSWHFPPLISVISAPTLRPDGSILDRPGYDVATGLFFDAQKEGFPPIPAAPSREEGVGAVHTLNEELFNRACLNSERPQDRGFSFAQDSDRSAALAALLTALVRPSLPTAPLFLNRATRPGSAKTLLADIPALVATGRPATIFELGADADEVEKRMLSVLLSGDAVINLDNLEVPLAGATLCKALSGETITGRLLGFNKNATVPTTALFLATGNNVQVVGDMTRRVVVINLDPESEAPENRQYDRNLATWIPEHRPRLVQAALTALRSYIAAGRPRQTPWLMGSFEDWDIMVRQALIWLGQPDPLAGAVELESADPVRRKLRALLVAWYSTFRSAGATSKEAVARAMETRQDHGGETVCPAQSLFEVLDDGFTDKQGKLSSRMVGEFLKRYCRRMEIGARFEEWGSSQNRMIWRVAIIDEQRFRKFLA